MDSKSATTGGSVREAGRNAGPESHRSAGTCCHDSYGFYAQDAFREMLSRERKRTERSHNPFVLVLIDLSGTRPADRQRGVAQSLAAAMALRRLLKRLAELTRDIDIKGWYEQGRCIGVIFTEVKADGKDTIVRKVRAAVDTTLEAPDRELVEVTGTAFPPDPGSSSGTRAYPLAFYPEVTGNSVGRMIALGMKRLLDIVGSIAGVLLFLPVFLVVPVLIKLTSKGPVFFRQTRVGLAGKTFRLFKFRSMYVDSDDAVHREYVSNLIRGGSSAEGGQTEQVYKITNDPRVTAVGRFLRRTSFDELPQFFNVLIGHMSLVGPRPAIPYETEQYDVWHQRRVLECKPGITGIWQVEGRSVTTFDGMVRMDLRYGRRRSVLLDLELIFRTPLAMLTAKGAY